MQSPRVSIFVNDLFFIKWKHNDKAVGGIYRYVETSNSRVNKDVINNTSYKINRFVMPISIFGINISSNIEYYVRVYGFENVADSSRIFLIEDKDGNLVLPKLRNGNSNFKNELGLDEYCAGVTVGNHEFLYEEPKHVTFSRLKKCFTNFDPEINNKVIELLESHFT